MKIIGLHENIFFYLSFKGFEDTTKFCYAFIVNDGPIWSIKFHPCSSSEKRIGLMAVTTANQSVLIYSLPYLNNNKPIVLTLEPNLICKLDYDDVFFNEEHLLQVSKVNWFYSKATGNILAAGYINGYVAIWNIEDDLLDERIMLPNHVMQPHLERVTTVEFKGTTGSDVLLLTTSVDRKIKVFNFDGIRWLEIAYNYSVSRVLSAEWWLNWPSYLIGFDNCFTAVPIIHRQPLDFGMRSSSMLAMEASILSMSINHWLNFAMFVTESGDVVGCRPEQMFLSASKTKWTSHNFSMFASTDFQKIHSEGNEETGVVFADFKVSCSYKKNLKTSQYQFFIYPQ
jgi:hypothetical protein